MRVATFLCYRYLSATKTRMRVDFFCRSMDEEDDEGVDPVADGSQVNSNIHSVSLDFESLVSGLRILIRMRMDPH
jgi:hypothetical protein